MSIRKDTEGESCEEALHLFILSWISLGERIAILGPVVICRTYLPSLISNTDNLDNRSNYGALGIVIGQTAR